MDGLGYSFESFMDFLREKKWIRQDECCVGNIELWEKDDEPFTFSKDTPCIAPSNIEVLVNKSGGTMDEFIQYVN